MSAPSWGRVKDLLHQAIALGPESRAKFLDEVCASDAALRAELESLLAVGDGLSAEFLQSPPTGKFAAGSEELGAAGLAEGQLFAERFQLIRKLGEGGMGQVWLAKQTAPVRRPVALKLIKAGMYDETVLHRFQAERQSLAIMDHPAIAKVFDAGITPLGQPYFVMEYVPGLPITEYCDQHKLNIRQRVELLIQACDGVQHAHQKAIIHRDLKPANILIVEVDGKPMPRIIDFGLAKATTAPLADQTLYTRFGQFMGTPGYMSPEQVDPNIEDIDTRTDVYSLGVILYVLLTGLLPFETRRREKPALDVWLRQLREEEPPRPSGKVSADRDTATDTSVARGTEPKHLASLLRGDLDWIAMKALERDRERRYGTPAELAADLRRYLNDEPVFARPASAGYQIRKFVRRHRIAAGFIATSTTLAIVASIAALIATQQNHEAQVQQHEAQHQAERALQAQSRLLTQAAAQRLKDSDVAGAQGIILEVLTNPEFARDRSPAAISAFQEIRAVDAQLGVLSGHQGRVYAAAFSPDGARIVTASADRTARIWDARTGAKIMVLEGHGSIVDDAAYSPDGTHIVTASFDNTARVWDARNGAQVVLLAGHGNRVHKAAYSPDGKHIVTASDDGTARIWDARTGAQLRLLKGHDNAVQSAAFSPDGSRIVTASKDDSVRIWDSRTGAQLLVISGHAATVQSALYSPDGRRIVTASDDKSARVWDARTGAQLTKVDHGDYVWSAVFSPDGTQFATASVDKTAALWDARSGARVAVLSGHGGYVSSAAFSSDGARIVTASYDNTARIWNPRRSAELAVLSGDHGVISTGMYSPDGTRILTASWDGTARIWDARTNAQVAVLSGHHGLLGSAKYSPDGARILTASNDKTIRIWDARTGAQLAELFQQAPSTGNFAYYSPDGARVIVPAEDNTARILDANTAEQLAVLSGHGGYVLSAAYSPDGARIVTASEDKTARIWDAHTGARLAVLAGHGDWVAWAEYSPSGKQIVTTSFDRTARIWDAHANVQLMVLSGHRDALFGAAYSPDGTRIATTSADKTARIWDARTGIQLAVFAGHRDTVSDVAFSPDGARIVTTSFDHTARIWDARVPAELEAQILWDSAAQTDPLPDADRTQLGLPPDPHRRNWDTEGSACDQAAAAIYDPDRITPGILQASINADIANSACSEDIRGREHAARSDYEMGRALFAMGKTKDAKKQLDLAVSKGYRAARIDLAQLLVSTSTNKVDIEVAVALYERAWKEGVPFAAFELAYFYEHEPRPDLSKAWPWYQKGADAGEPNALARFAERAETAAMTESDPKNTDAGLLDAFRYYAGAAQFAHDEDWPDEAWKHWRYRRATLARLLANDGLMPQVAAAYAAVLDRTTLRPQTPWSGVWIRRANEGSVEYARIAN